MSNKKNIKFDLILSSLISKKIKIIDSLNKNQIGMKGIIIFETYNFIHILDYKYYNKYNNNNFCNNINLIKKISKNNLIIEIVHKDMKIKLNCNVLKGTIQNRIKKIK